VPRRRGGRAHEYDERRFLTRQQLARLLAEIPTPWRPLFELLASTGLRISEAIALRVMDAALDPEAPCIHVRRAIVNGQLTAPKSRHGRRTIPISLELADRLRELGAGRGETELLFRGAHGAALRAGQPALPRAHTGRKACRRPLGALSHAAPYLRGHAHRRWRQPASPAALGWRRPATSRPRSPAAAGSAAKASPSTATR
jgi:integrase